VPCRWLGVRLVLWVTVELGLWVVTVELGVLVKRWR
jgi:hypothetical protein